MEITIEEIQQKFESLPEDLRWAIMAADVDEKITEIGQMQGLNVEQMGQLSLETHMVMFGFTHPDKFQESLEGSMQLGPDKTRMLVNAVNEKILKDLRDKIMSLHHVRNIEEKEITEAPKSAENQGEILKSAGIEILEKPTPGEEMVQKLKEEPKPILAQKLGGSFKTETTETAHTTSDISTKTPPTSSNTSIPLAGKSSLPKVDPYREVLE